MKNMLRTIRSLSITTLLHLFNPQNINNRLTTLQPQKLKQIKSSQPQTKFTGSYKTKCKGRIYFEDSVWNRLSVKVSNPLVIFKMQIN